MEDVLYDVENILHLAADAGLAILKLSFLLPGNTVVVVPPEGVMLPVDFISSRYTMLFMA